MKFSNTLCLALMGFALTTTAAQASEYAADDTVIQGADCQALYGSQEDRLTHNIDWLTNSSGNTWVSCGLPRHSIQKTSPAPEVKIRVYRPNSNSPLDCQLHVRAVNNSSWNVSDSAVVGWSYVTLTPADTAPGASYAVRCKLPTGGKIQKVVIKE